MPNSMEKTLKTMGLGKINLTLDSVKNINLLKPGNTLKKADILFKKIESE